MDPFNTEYGIVNLLLGVITKYITAVATEISEGLNAKAISYMDVLVMPPLALAGESNSRKNFDRRR